uniref:Uncharacterized protein n=1 Tax=Arundo donax TaxID=35708 RepID=A0A0A8Z3V1_ARUDO
MMEYEYERTLKHPRIQTAAYIIKGLCILDSI